jgi:hypothetical protein
MAPGLRTSALARGLAKQRAPKRAREREREKNQEERPAQAGAYASGPLRAVHSRGHHGSTDILCPARPGIDLAFRVPRTASAPFDPCGPRPLTCAKQQCGACMVHADLVEARTTSESIT